MMRSSYIRLRMTDEEVSELEARAQKAGVSKSAYVRYAIKWWNGSMRVTNVAAIEGPGKPAETAA